MEEKFTITEGYELPSKGLVYDKPVNPHIQLRSWTTREEMLRQGHSSTPYKKLADMIEGCIVSEKPSVHVYDMCIGDFEYLLHKERVVTYGAEYKMVASCPKCGSIESIVCNLDDLKVQDFDINEYRDLQTLRLPKSDKVITLKMQTPRILDEIELKVAEFKKRNKNVDMDPTMMITIQLMIDTIDGNKFGFTDLEDIVANLPAADSLAIIDRIEELNRKVGLDTSFEYKCGQCGFDVLTFFRFGPEFFRPTNN